MRLFDAIVEANHRALAGDPAAGLHPTDFTCSLPVAALTCIDPRLNPLFPDILGLPKEQFVWLRNAGNIIHGPLTSTMRSLALACAIKGAREVAIIGHTDCHVGQTTTYKLTEAFRELGVERSKLPENLTEYFGLFASERQNVLTSVEHVRHSPLIGRKIPVHGLMVDVHTGKIEWLDNGYEYAQSPAVAPSVVEQLASESTNALKTFAEF
jgi:carbonic anhydrase